METRANGWAMLAAQRARAVFLRLGGWASLRRLRATEVAAWRAARLARQRRSFREGVASLREGFREDTAFAIVGMPRETWRDVRRYRPSVDQLRTRDRLEAEQDRARAQLVDVRGGCWRVRPAWTSSALRPGERRWCAASSTWEVWDDPRPLLLEVGGGGRECGEDAAARRRGECGMLAAALTLAARSDWVAAPCDMLRLHGVPVGWRLALHDGRHSFSLLEFYFDAATTARAADGRRWYACDWVLRSERLAKGGAGLGFELAGASLGGGVADVGGSGFGGGGGLA